MALQTEWSKLAEQLHAAHLSFTDVERLSSGRLKVSRLKKASVGIQPFTPEESIVINQIIAATRMANEHVKFVVFEAVSALPKASVG